VDRGVPGEDDDPGVAGRAGEKGVVEGAGDWGPERQAQLRVVLKKINTAASATAGGSSTGASYAGSWLVPIIEVKRAMKGRTYGRPAEKCWTAPQRSELRES
jgi:hypothetical protein